MRFRFPTIEEDIARQAVKEYPCADCYDPDTDVHPEVTVNFNAGNLWRGWVVRCEECGEIIVEYDEPKRGGQKYIP